MIYDSQAKEEQTVQEAYQSPMRTKAKKSNGYVTKERLNTRIQTPLRSNNTANTGKTAAHSETILVNEKRAKVLLYFHQTTWT